MTQTQAPSRPSYRATALRREFEALTAQTPHDARHAEVALTATLTNVYDMLVETIGPVLALDDRQKLSVAALLSKHARLHAAGDRAKSQACALLSLHFKALAVPGADADFVIGATKEMIEAAFARRRRNASSHEARPSA